jgi:hypothetical protein
MRSNARGCGRTARLEMPRSRPPWRCEQSRAAGSPSGTRRLYLGSSYRRGQAWHGLVRRGPGRGAEYAALRYGMRRKRQRPPTASHCPFGRLPAAPRTNGPELSAVVAARQNQQRRQQQPHQRYGPRGAINRAGVLAAACATPGVTREHGFQFWPPVAPGIHPLQGRLRRRHDR